ncbi:MAG TPA: phosphatidate cytidylyltransferase, partial [Myxococcota bacterium]|nr:phosphatidate cytidylyltransferase [Myxococcota bacterium]
MSQLVSLAPLPLWMALGAVYGFIAISTAVAMAIPSVRRSPNMINPILGWWPVSIVGTLAVFLGPGPSVAVLGAVSTGVFLEALALVGLPPRLHRLIATVGVVIVMLVHLMMLVDGALATTLAWALPMLLVPAAQLFHEATTGFIRNVGGAQWILLATVGMFSFAARLVTGEVGGPYGGQGAAVVFFVLVMLSDALQWLGGKLLGRTPLVPRVSPKKTWEGFLFGAATCAAAGTLIAPPLMGLSVGMAAVLGASIVALGLFGDILASGWKRDAGVKDSGTL